ncbi:MAG: binding-protein-dependent transport system inner rane component, partial [Thermomicrobiales bacterium]|nr:binding-protein-dependent transport system inner rane component [Thermomicrobiales bacterium]
NPPVWIPSEVTFVHYQSVMADKGSLALRNSLIIAGSATLISVLIGSLAAYSLARFNTGGRHLGFWLLSQRMLPPVVLVIPFFLILREAGKINPRLGIDQHLPLIVLYAVFNLPFVIWMMRSYFASVPAEIEESAMIDGATRLGALRQITLPLALPGLVATTVFAFIFSWTEFLFAVVFTRVLLGPGLMGAQIACEYAIDGHEVTVLARRPELASERIGRGFATGREHGLVSDAEADAARGRIAITGAETSIEDADIIVESVVEDLAAKQAALAPVVARNPGAIVASNTSSIPITAIGQAIGAGA